MNRVKVERLMMEDVKIDYRNFSGKTSQYNREGERNFVVLLEEEQAEILAAQGWNVKFKPPYEDGDPPKIFLPVAVRYKNARKPPRVVLLTNRGRKTLDEGDLNVLDFAYIKHVDLIINPYVWEIRDKDDVRTGIKAYLDSAYITIEENPFEEKYSDLPVVDEVVVDPEII